MKNKFDFQPKLVSALKNYSKEKFMTDLMAGIIVGIVALPLAIADIAEEEGFKTIAVAFRMIAKVEAEHEKRYRKLLSNIETGTVFEKAEAILWQCRNCGFVIESKKAPQKCPACEHPQAYFEPMKQNY